MSAAKQYLRRALREANVTALISIDTNRSVVARAAVDAGADVVNDISGGSDDPRMLPTGIFSVCRMLCVLFFAHFSNSYQLQSLVYQWC